MSRPKLRSPDQSLPLRLLLGLYEAAASLTLAVLLIFGAAFVLGYATFVERWYGLRGAHFGVYQTWWFAGLIGLLAINIFCAAAIRYPWKRHQTGFVITHIGLLVLLFGCYLQHRGGIDAQMPVFEGHSAHIATQDDTLLVVEQFPKDADIETAEPSKLAVVPLDVGPFNWSDYETKLPSFPWKLAHRDGGIVGAKQLSSEGIDGVTIELLDYYSECQEISAPMVKLGIGMPNMRQISAGEKADDNNLQWNYFSLAVRGADQFDYRPYGLGQRQELGGGAFVFWMAAGEAEAEAFLDSAPEPDKFGTRGQVVLFVDGQRYNFEVDKLKEDEPQPLGDTGYQVALKKYTTNGFMAEGGTLAESNSPSEEAYPNPAVELELLKKDQRVGGVILFADRVESNLPDYQNEIFGTYWFKHPDLTSQELMRGRGRSRIDIIQAPVKDSDEFQLLYRYWDRSQVKAMGKLPADGEAIDAFQMPAFKLKMKVDEFVSMPTPGTKILPVEYDKDTVAASANRAAKFRVGANGETETFWLVGPPVDPLDMPLPPSARKVINLADRQLVLRLPLEQIDIGFRVYLEKFTRKLDPGTTQPSHYYSVVDFQSMDGKPLEDSVTITMNAPVDYAAPDKSKAKTYRLFQESFFGPLKKNDPAYNAAVQGSTYRPDNLYMSTLTVNYDPGRGIKYAGCLLVVAGIATMFYMRAYFFKPRQKKTATPAASKPAKAGEKSRQVAEVAS